MKKTYIYREVSEKKELEKLYRLRHSLYDESVLSGFLPKNAEAIDITPFDLHAKQLALFDGEEMIATQRMVVDKNLFYCNATAELISELHLPISPEEIRNTADFPVLTYQEIHCEMSEFYTELKEQDIKMVEVGRFAIKEEVRGIRMLKHLFDCLNAYASLWFDKKGICITSTQTRHLKLYYHVGFKNLINYFVNNLDTTTLIVECCDDLEMSSIPVKHHEKLKKMKNDLKSKGGITTEL